MADDFTNKILDAGASTLVNSFKKTLDNPDFMQSALGKFLTAFGAGAVGGAAAVYIYEKYLNPNKISTQDIAELKLLVQQNTLQQQKLQLQNQQGLQPQFQNTNMQSQQNRNKPIEVTPEILNNYEPM